MTAFCPNGHHSDSVDYCDTCGTPMSAAPPGGAAPEAGAAPEGVLASPVPPVPPRPIPAPASPAVPPGTAPSVTPGGGPGASAVPATRPCPHCGATNEVDDLFCEACGYDFTTGTPPMDAAAIPTAIPDDTRTATPDDTPTATPTDTPDDTRTDTPTATGLDLDESPPERGAGRSSLDLEPPTPEAAPEPDLGPGPETGAEPGPDPGLDPAPTPAPPPAVPMPLVKPAPGPPPVSPPPAAPAEPGPVPMPRVVLPSPAAGPPSAGPPSGGSPGAPVEQRRRPQYRPPSQQAAPDWVVEIWIDPEWYAVQRSEQDCPSPDVPDVVPVRGRTALVGRPSATRNVHPDVDCGSDTGVSRRHAQFTSDGRRWWIEDLGSANGTYVGSAGAALPVDPIDIGRKVEVDAADRIYVGAWTRLVIRPATESERAGTG